MSKKIKKPPTILALKRPTPPATEQPVANDAPPPPPLSPEPSSEVAENTRVESKPKVQLVTLPSATNAAGEVFHVGDQILSRAPWGGRALTEIVLIYQGGDGAWVQYKPNESAQEGWQWEGGVMRAEVLIKGSL